MVCSGYRSSIFMAINGTLCKGKEISGTKVSYGSVGYLGPVQ